MTAIVSMDQFIANVQSQNYFAKPQTTAAGGTLLSFWGVSGVPGPGSFNSTLAGGTYSSSSALVNGQLPHTDPAGGINAYVNRFTCAVTPFSGQGMILLCDRLWDNGGISVTSSSAQTINSPTWPARDSNGATTGTSVMLGLEVSAVTAGSGNPTLSISYTNSFGTSGRVTTGADVPRAVSNPGYFYRIAYHSGDAGVQSVQSLTFGGTQWTSGTVNLVAYRVITALAYSNGSSSFTHDSATGALPQVYNGTVPFIIAWGGFTSAGLSGIYQEVQI